MTDIVIKLRKTAEDIAAVQGYSGYVRTQIEAAAEIERLREEVRKIMESSRSKNKQRGK